MSCMICKKQREIITDITYTYHEQWSGVCHVVVDYSYYLKKYIKKTKAQLSRKVSSPPGTKREAIGGWGLVPQRSKAPTKGDVQAQLSGNISFQAKSRIAFGQSPLN